MKRSLCLIGVRKFKFIAALSQRTKWNESSGVEKVNKKILVRIFFSPGFHFFSWDRIFSCPAFVKTRVGSHALLHSHTHTHIHSLSLSLSHTHTHTIAACTLTHPHAQTLSRSFANAREMIFFSFLQKYFFFFSEKPKADF